VSVPERPYREKQEENTLKRKESHTAFRVRFQQDQTTSGLWDNGSDLSRIRFQKQHIKIKYSACICKRWNNFM